MKTTCILKQNGISGMEYMLFQFLVKKLEFLSSATIARCGKPQVLTLGPLLLLINIMLLSEAIMLLASNYMCAVGNKNNG